jgi:hypothetical protein
MCKKNFNLVRFDDGTPLWLNPRKRWREVKGFTKFWLDELKYKYALVTSSGKRKRQLQLLHNWEILTKHTEYYKGYCNCPICKIQSEE